MSLQRQLRRGPSNKILCVILGATILGVSLAAGSSEEQSVFSAEGRDIAPLLRPVEIPPSVLQILRRSTDVLNCVENDGISSDQVLASWFVGSEIHLHGAGEVDLVVQPREMSESPAPNHCLSGANTMPFWVFVKRGERYLLALSVPAHDLRVLKTRSKGYRDIAAQAMNCCEIQTVTYRFDGESYRIYRRKSQRIGGKPSGR